MDRIALVPDITHLLYNYISKTGVVVLFIYFFLWSYGCPIRGSFLLFVLRLVQLIE